MNAVNTNMESDFQGAKREQSSILAPFERSALNWLASRMPKWVSSDHLTLLGLAAMFLAGLFYFFSRWDPIFLHFVNFWIAVNWFGDSLDGTIARYRNMQRPRYGFYVDHIVDTFGAFFLLLGLALSNYMGDRVAVGLLIVYYMLSINVYLAAYTIGTFKLSFWKLSPTELRIIFIAGNLVLIYYPNVKILGGTYLLYDIVGMVSIVVMSLMLIRSVIKNTKVLYRSERIQ